MSLIENLHARVDALANHAFFRELVQRQAREAFVANRDKNLFFGIHPNWDEAAEAAKAFGTVGYDNPAAANLYNSRVRMDPHDYPR